MSHAKSDQFQQNHIPFTFWLARKLIAYLSSLITSGSSQFKKVTVRCRKVYHNILVSINKNNDTTAVAALAETAGINLRKIATAQHATR